jgi:hypothetical protein
MRWVSQELNPSYHPLPIHPGSGLLDAIGLVAAATLLADQAELRLQRIRILDLALGVADRAGEACDVLVEAGLVGPDLVRGLVVAVERLALEARGKSFGSFFAVSSNCASAASTVA